MSKIVLTTATIDDYPTIQNLARFYVYDMSRSCGFTSSDWACPADGLYESFDFRIYFEDPTREAFVVKVDDELAGFILLNKLGTEPTTDWNIGEFFILARFQGKGVGAFAAHQLWNKYPGIWEIRVIPENTPALGFWRKAVMSFTGGNYQEQLKELNRDHQRQKRYVFKFNTIDLNSSTTKESMPKISFVDTLSEELEQRMSAGFVSYEKSCGIDVNYQRFSVLLSNEKEVVCGVINAYTAFSEVYVDDIWVDSLYRGKGYGRLLLQALEGHFTGRGYNNINLVTSAFQAPEFYKKCGYTAEFIRQNQVNPQLSKVFFVKYFSDKEQRQGILSTDS